MATGHSTATLIADFVVEARDVLRGIGQLFRVEVGEKVSQATRATVFVAVAAVLLIAALIFFLSAAADWLTSLGLQKYWSDLIVGGVVAIVGAGLLLKALQDLKPANLKPQRTLDQMQKVFLAARAEVK